MDFNLAVRAEYGTLSENTRKGPLLSRNDQKWESLREDIRRIYKAENNTLSKTMLIVEEQHKLKAS
jgi:hypothetical protein